MSWCTNHTKTVFSGKTASISTSNTFVVPSSLVLCVQAVNNTGYKVAMLMHCLAHIFRILLICPYTEPYAHIPVPLTWFPVVYSKVINLIVLVEFCLWWNKNVKRFWHVISQCPSVFCQSAHDRWQFKGRLPGSAKRAGFRGRWSLTLGSQSRTAGHSAVKCFLISLSQYWWLFWSHVHLQSSVSKSMCGWYCTTVIKPFPSTCTVRPHCT